MKLGGNCCKLPSKAPEGNKGINEISVAEVDGISALQEEQSMTLTAFLGGFPFTQDWLRQEFWFKWQHLVVSHGA